MQLVVKDDKLQKYRDHVQHGAGLSPRDKLIFDRYFYAFHQLLDGCSERQVVNLLVNLDEPLGGVSQSHAYNIVNGAQEIFGVLDLSNSKKTAQRYIYATRLEEMAARLQFLAEEVIDKHSGPFAEEDGLELDRGVAEKEAGVLFEKAANILMKAAKVRGLLEKDQVENPNKWKAAPNIIFTDDLFALEVQQLIEDTTYDDVTGNEGEAQAGENAPTGSEG